MQPQYIEFVGQPKGCHFFEGQPQKRSNPWRLSQPLWPSRVTSVRFYYLTSLINLSFCRIGTPAFLTKIESESRYFSEPQFEKPLFPGNLPVHWYRPLCLQIIIFPRPFQLTSSTKASSLSHAKHRNPLSQLTQSGYRIYNKNVGAWILQLHKQHCRTRDDRFPGCVFCFRIFIR